MELLHKADLRPSKMGLLNGWLPSQPWFSGDAEAGITKVASFRFDDPDGEVGIETLLVQAGEDAILQHEFHHLVRLLGTRKRAHGA